MNEKRLIKKLAEITTKAKIWNLPIYDDLKDILKNIASTSLRKLKKIKK